MYIYNSIFFIFNYWVLGNGYINLLWVSIKKTHNNNCFLNKKLLPL